MAPLSTMNFIKNNKRHILASVIAIVVAIVFLFNFECFIQSMISSSTFATGSTFDKLISVSRMTDDAIPENAVKAAENSSDIDRVMPAVIQATQYQMFGSGGGAMIFGLHSSDLPYFMKVNGTKLTQGRLPKSENEIALDIHVVKNEKVKIGSKIGNSVNSLDSLQGEYTVVGILQGSDCVSISGDPFTRVADKTDDQLLQNGYIAFPKKGKLAEAGDDLQRFSSTSTKVYTKSYYFQQINQTMGGIQILDEVAIMAVLVMAVCLVFAKYAQIYNRRNEFGILGALGCSRQSIMLRTFNEVAIVNFVSFIIGLALAVLCSYLLIGGIFSKPGGIPVYIFPKAVLLSLLAPLFTTLFTLIPVFRMLGSVDPIAVIESA